MMKQMKLTPEQFEKRYKILRDLNKSLVLSKRDMTGTDPVKAISGARDYAVAMTLIEDQMVKWGIVPAL